MSHTEESWPWWHDAWPNSFCTSCSIVRHHSCVRRRLSTPRHYRATIYWPATRNLYNFWMPSLCWVLCFVKKVQTPKSGGKILLRHETLWAATKAAKTTFTGFEWNRSLEATVQKICGQYNGHCLTLNEWLPYRWCFNATGEKVAQCYKNTLTAFWNVCLKMILFSATNDSPLLERIAFLNSEMLKTGWQTRPVDVPLFHVVLILQQKWGKNNIWSFSGLRDLQATNKRQKTTPTVSSSKVAIHSFILKSLAQS